MQDENTRLLGQQAHGPISADQLDTVPWNHGDTDATVEFFDG